jgi:hypothetical protein
VRPEDDHQYDVKLPPSWKKFYRDKKNILLAADLWYSIRKHWCIEVKRWILAGKHEQGTAGPWPVN